MYQPQHPNEGIMIVDRLTHRSVREIFGGPGRMEQVTQNLNHDRYYPQYAGEYLGNLHKTTLTDSHHA
jgi:hypothetical protein